jgi:hypothetical protein
MNPVHGLDGGRSGISLSFLEENKMKWTTFAQRNDDGMDEQDSRVP